MQSAFRALSPSGVRAQVRGAGGGSLAGGELHRRGFLAAGISALMAGGATAGVQPFFRRHQLPIGIQLYMLGPDVAKDLDGSLRAVADIGYRAVELYNFYDRTPKQFRAALDGAGLSCRSAQVRGRGQLDGDLGKLADDLTTLGVRKAVMTIPIIPDRLGRSPSPGEGIGDWLRRVVGQLTVDDWKMNADFLNEKAAGMARSGIKLGYHNHDFEFVPFGGVTGLDILLKHTDPELVTFQLDVGWAASAGVDPMSLLTKYKGRFSLMHVKDIKAGARPNFGMRMEPAELGAGQLVWKDLLPASYSAGVRDFYVEQEAPFSRPRLEAAKINHDFLARLS